MPTDGRGTLKPTEGRGTLKPTDGRGTLKDNTSVGFKVLLPSVVIVMFVIGF
jgi:hypothetical protein